ncbi:flagellar basal body P-ring formation chaperone FlgA [Breoghania sp. JC706]|uniref:flagellar basal body P-ring formation chaperone FlgA n=1 Tax=Breoghania sp. JC706 TaxID=3117732 RepID=UPI0030091C13
MKRHLLLLALAAALPLAGSLSGAPALNAAAEAAPLVAQRPTLRVKVTATREIVTVGDFFENPGPYADRALFRAPDLGRTGTVSAFDVVRRARAAGLGDADAGSVREVVVHRAALSVGPEALAKLIRTALAARTGSQSADDLEIEYSDPLPTLTADPAALEPVKLLRLEYSSYNGRFDALFSVENGHENARFTVFGVARETAEIVTFAKRIARGETVSAHDLETIRVPKTALRDDTVTDPANIIGMAVRRPMAPGRPLASRDFEEPLAVERRSKVIITYKVAGLTLTVQGEAMADGTKGDVIDVLNIQSRRTIQAVVTGPGRVSVQPRTARIASLEEARK